MILRRTACALLAFAPMVCASGQDADTLATEMRDVQVSVMRSHRGMGIETKELVGKGDLIRAACCNLGESFTNSASVDVSYADPATGVRQVKLLGLSGTYVQMMTENIPNYHAVAMPYALNFVPGTWMQSIQVSKGASSVKNGYESMTGQINIEFLKPQAEKSFHANAYLDQRLRYELNLDGNRQFGESGRWSGGYLLHFDHRTMQDDMNHDGFRDDPTGLQVSGMARLAYVSPKYIMQFRGSALYDDHTGGVKGETSSLLTNQTTNSRWEAHLKNAYIFNSDKDGNVALILSASQQRLQNDGFAHRSYKVAESDLYASLMFEEQFTLSHGLSTGLSFQREGFADEALHFWQDVDNDGVKDDVGLCALTPSENTVGAYAQYTYTLDDKLAIMAGIRLDHSDLYGTFVTPRAHLRWHPTDWFTMRASAGKGYRTPHLLPEMHYLLASGRHWVGLDSQLPQEESWNTGTSMQFSIPVCDKKLELNADYYYTHFLQQVVVDRDADPFALKFYALNGRSFSHCLQVDATYPFFEGFSLTGAWRMNYVRTTYQDGRLRETPLTSRWKGLLTATYKTPLELWQFDVTCQLNGPGRMPDPYVVYNSQFTIHDSQLGGSTMSWDKEYKTFPQLSAQVTRFFRWGSVYVGGENLTNFHLKHPIIAADAPLNPEFEPTMVWGPVHGAMVYAGVRVEL